MKKLIFLIVLVSVFGFAQNQRFLYEYKFVVDSTKKDEVKSEMLVLDLNDKGSKFYSYAKFQADSLSAVDLEKQVKAGSNDIFVKNNYKGSIRYLVQKSYPDYQVQLQNSIGGDDYNILDDRKIKWKILPETAVIGTFKTQKAEAEIYGRKWSAWFAPEIPVQDGPNKFHGLPGLIVKIEDMTKSHSFELKGIRKDVASTDTSRHADNAVDITQAQYKKLFWENRKDPAKSLRLMINQDPTFKIIKNGVEVSGEQMLREREKTAREVQKKNNNFLELDLLTE